MRTGERLRMEGREEGRKEGREEGREEGRREAAVEATQRALRSVMRVRFGAPPEWVEAKILAADAETLHGWITLAAAAPNLDAVFSPA